MRNLTLHCLLLAAAAGCGGNEPTEDYSLCLQTSEFGNTGCAEVAGAVADPQGAAVVGAFVGVSGPVDPARPVTLSSGEVRSDPTGRYSGRVIRYTGDVPAVGPDTLSVWVRATVPAGPELPPGTPGRRDSVVATLEFRPVGDTPVTIDVVTIVIAEP